jgi:hypothetical protein
MSKKSLLAAAFSAVAITGATASAAFAGEVTGNGKPTAAPTHTNSICAFSGQNDGEPPAGRKAEHVQNWGQIPQAVRDILRAEGESPGDACNGHRGIFAGGGSE